MENTSKKTGNIGSGTEKPNQFENLNLGGLTDMLGNMNVPEMLKKYGGTATKAISGLSTTQKVIGGALLILGARYLSKRSGKGYLKMNKKKSR